jgi:hypothetical protein
MRRVARLSISDFRFPDPIRELRTSRARLLVHEAVRERSTAATVAPFGREPAEIARAGRFWDSFPRQQLVMGSDRPASRRTTLRSSASLRSTSPQASASVFLRSRNDRGGRRRADLACSFLPDSRACSQIPERASEESRIETDGEEGSAWAPTSDPILRSNDSKTRFLEHRRATADQAWRAAASSVGSAIGCRQAKFSQT